MPMSLCFFVCLQTERAFQKQPTIFLNKKKNLALGKASKKALRYVKSVGLGFKTPREVREKHTTQCIMSSVD